MLPHALRRKLILQGCDPGRQAACRRLQPIVHVLADNIRLAPAKRGNHRARTNRFVRWFETNSTVRSTPDES